MGGKYKGAHLTENEQCDKERNHFNPRGIDRDLEENLVEV